MDIVLCDPAYPVFNQFEVFGDRFTAVSPDSKTLRAWTWAGRDLWRRPMVGHALVAREDDAHLSVQEENTILRVRVTDATTEKLFDVPEHQRFVSDRTHGLVYLIDQRFDKNTFQLLDPRSRRSIWQREDIERILHVEQNLIVVSTVRREYDANESSYTTRDVAVIGLDRKTGEVRWRIPLNGPTVYVRAASVPPCLVVIDDGPGGGLLCVETASGRILGRRADPRTWGFSYWDVVADGNHVVVLERTTNDETFLRFDSVPSFEVTASLRLASFEPSVSFDRTHIFLKGLYRGICFDRQTGTQRWKRDAMGDWKLLGDHILLGNYGKWRGRARIIVLDIESGREHVIVDEPADFPPRWPRWGPPGSVP